MSIEAQSNQTEMGQWLEHGGMRDVPLQPGEAGWVSWHIGQGPRNDDREIMHGSVAVMGAQYDS